jgi:hypothetical protein
LARCQRDCGGLTSTCGIRAAIEALGQHSLFARPLSLEFANVGDAQRRVQQPTSQVRSLPARSKRDMQPSCDQTLRVAILLQVLFPQNQSPLSTAQQMAAWNSAHGERYVRNSWMDSTLLQQGIPRLDLSGNPAVNRTITQVPGVPQNMFMDHGTASLPVRLARSCSDPQIGNTDMHPCNLDASLCAT